MKPNDCYYVPTLANTCELLFLLGSTLMGNGDMPSETLVDVVHHLAKDLTMSTCVLNAVGMDVIVYHLMDDSVLHFIFGQVKTNTDAETEIVEFKFAEQFPPLLIYKHTKEGLGVA